MEVILLERVAKLGQIGDVVRVKDGFARNFLLPKGKALRARDHGRVPGDVQFYNSEVAHKYKMSSMQAALGLAQLERVEELVQRKRNIFAMYQEAFADADGVLLNTEPEDTKNSYWMITAVWDRAFKKSKNDIVLALRDGGVNVRPFFHPLSSLPAYANFEGVALAKRSNVVSYDIGVRAVNLPSGFTLSADDVKKVRDLLLSSLTLSG